MKHLKPPGPEDGRASEATRKRRTAMRFGFSAIIASFVVIGMLIGGAMFQEEYEEGFVRLVSFAVRLATPEEKAEAEAQGPIPAPLRSVRPDTPVALNPDPLVDLRELSRSETVPPVAEALIPVEGLIVETPDGLELLPPGETLPESPPGSQASDDPNASPE